MDVPSRRIAAELALRSLFALSISASMLSLAGCEGRIEGTQPAQATGAGGASDSTTSSVGQTPEQILASDLCQAPSPGRAPLRRLSNAEYRNTVADLLGDTAENEALIATATSTFSSETESLGFRNNADYLGVNTLIAQAYMDAAEQLVDKIAESHGFLPCTPTPGKEIDCGRTFIQAFGPRAFRRPLSQDESTRYEAIFQSQLNAYDFDAAVRATAFAFLQSPNFLYRVEFGANLTGSFTKPSPYEMANRLSYLFWQSLPDQALFDAAAANQLTSPAQIEAQARRLLKDPKSARLLEYFDQWLGTDTLNSTFVRDATVYPNISANLVPLLQQETRTFVADLLSQPSGSLGELFTAQYTFANGELANHYGLSGVSGNAFVKVDAPGRAGVLTQGMLLARDKPTRTSIVRRGLKIRLDILCEDVPAPPPGVNVNLDSSTTKNLTQRARLEQHRVSPSCSSCHDLMDPVGVVFEGFDAVGRPRTVDEQGAAIDTTSVIDHTEDANGSASNPAELGQLLANSEEAKSCYVKKSFRFFYGRDLQATPDACSIAELLKSFKGNAYSLSELLIALTQTDAFMYRPVLSESP